MVGVASLFCTQCGVELSPNANFCRRCGTRVRKNRNSFMNQISTNQMIIKAREKIDQSRDYVADKIDNLAETIKDQNKLSRLSSNQRDYLAQRLANIRTKIAREQQQSGSSEFEPTVEEAKEIVEINDELLAQLKTEKCLICYKDLESTDHVDELVICPQCGHGGHKGHIYSWFQSNKTCPYCKAHISVDQVLILSY